MKKSHRQTSEQHDGQTNGEPQDLGFGSVVAQESLERLLNPDGTFNVRRTGLSFWSSLSLYHSLLTMSWTKIISLIVAGYIGINAIFAGAYVLCGPGSLLAQSESGISNSFVRAFFFSAETFSTVGYGHIIPVGFAANVLVTMESLVGLLGFAFAAGLLFARFSRPTAKILFSKSAIVAPYQGITAFEFRIANARKNQIIELEATVLFAKFEGAGKEAVRRFYPLKLERSKVIFFPLHWTIVHPIDEHSPLYGLSSDDLLKSNAEFLILLSGTDETFSQVVQTRSSYKAEEVVWNARFGNIFNQIKNGRLSADIARLHLIEPVTELPPDKAKAATGKD
ncbi:MAG TPA: ion channel [Blastocatellia bacterium]|nr:ion channel [Blastocatellia bacterium]